VSTKAFNLWIGDFLAYHDFWDEIPATV